MADIVQARESFACTLPDGTPYSVVSGDLFAADDPLVKRAPHLFGALTTRSSLPADQPTSKATETATADPGSRRSASSAKSPQKGEKGETRA